MLSDEVREAIVEVLCGQALADHLGDVRDAEEKLWKLLGAPELSYSDDDFNDTSAWSMTKARLAKAGLPLPDYLSDDEEEEQW